MLLLLLLLQLLVVEVVGGGEARGVEGEAAVSVHVGGLERTYARGGVVEAAGQRQGHLVRAVARQRVAVLLHLLLLLVVLFVVVDAVGLQRTSGGLVRGQAGRVKRGSKLFNVSVSF